MHFSTHNQTLIQHSIRLYYGLRHEYLLNLIGRFGDTIIALAVAFCLFEPVIVSIWPHLKNQGFVITCPIVLGIAIWLCRLYSKALDRRIPCEIDQNIHIRELLESSVSQREHDLLISLLQAINRREPSAITDCLRLMDNPDHFAFLRNLQEDYVKVLARTTRDS